MEDAAQILMILFYREEGNLPSGDARHSKPLPNGYYVKDSPVNLASLIHRYSLRIK